jgi:hypothetical protein
MIANVETLQMKDSQIKCQFRLDSANLEKLKALKDEQTFFAEIKQIPRTASAASGFALEARLDQAQFGFNLNCLDTSGSKADAYSFSAVEGALADAIIVYVLPSVDEPKTWTKSQEIPSAISNIPGEEVNKYQAKPTHCRVYASDSNSVKEGRVKADDRTLIVGDSNELIRECQRWTTSLRNKCSSLEFAGHAYHLSVGINNYANNNDVIFGLNYDNDKYEHYPQDPQIFAKLTGCFDQILEKDVPIIFSTCGGAWTYVNEKNGTGHTRFYRGKAPAQERLSEMLNREIFSPLSYCCSINQGRDTYCGAGWYATGPKT